jgi:phosphoribosylformylglycinamidine synthase PurS subunit
MIKATVRVMLHAAILDPQGKAILGALKTLGVEGINDVRQGKLFEIVFKENEITDAVKAQVERAASQSLSNPVLEKFEIEYEISQD